MTFKKLANMQFKKRFNQKMYNREGDEMQAENLDNEIVK